MGGQGVVCATCLQECVWYAGVVGGRRGFKVGASTPNLRALQGLCCCTEFAVHRTLTTADRSRHTWVWLRVQCDWRLATFGHFALLFALSVNTHVNAKPKSSADTASNGNSSKCVAELRDAIIPIPVWGVGINRMAIPSLVLYVCLLQFSLICVCAAVKLGTVTSRSGKIC